MHSIKTILLTLIFCTSLWVTSVQSQNKSLEAVQVSQNQSLYQVASTWTNQNSEQLHLADFEGQPLIVVMFYGQCTGTCPVLMQRTWNLYSEISQNLRDQVQILAVSFDYKNDTPEALKNYAKHEQLNLLNWHFVTSQHSSIRELAMLLGVQYRERSDGHFEHTNLITVLDEEGRIAERVDGLTSDMASTARNIEQMIQENLQ